MENPSLIKRPLLVTISCALLFAGGLSVILYTFTGAFAPYGTFYPGVNVLFIIVMFAALSGIWSMEKWGVWIFLVILILKMGLDLWVKAFDWLELISLIPLIIFLGYVRGMK
jgi:hypothetical protein